MIISIKLLEMFQAYLLNGEADDHRSLLVSGVNLPMVQDLFLARRSLGRDKVSSRVIEAFNSVLEPAKRTFEGIKMITA